MNYRIAICDDEATELDKTEQILRAYQKEHSEYKMEIERFESAEELLFQAEEENYMPDLLILDVYLPKKLGTLVAKELRDMGSEGRIIFLTSSVEHALDAFEVEAAQYLVKPVSRQKLFEVLDKVFFSLEAEQKKYLLLWIDGRIRRIAVHEIVYCEAQGKCQYLYLADGSQHRLRMTMTEIYSKLSAFPEFVKVGNSYIASLEHVVSLNARDMSFDLGCSIYLPRGTYQRLREAYFRYYCGEGEGLP